MKTTNIFILTFGFLLVSLVKTSAQSYETTSKWNKNNAPAVAIDVNAPVEIAIQSFYDLLKSEKLKGKKSGKTASFEKVAFPSITTDYLNIYANGVAKDNNNSTMYVFVNKGIKSDFINSNLDADLIDKLKSYLNNKYVPAVAKDNLNFKINAQQKIIDSSSKDLEKMHKDLDKKIKQKDQLILDIDALEKQIQTQDSLVIQHKTNMEKIKSRK